ncbi:metal ABC transporter permease [Martelella alba]|uniref:Metal ABC transporter permease n=2 Tax=Martelella alba TaxID=2590451 RepID=A0ABY2SFM6_9HYPH|nr:metal ABC transporter permease [Martelella alba]
MAALLEPWQYDYMAKAIWVSALAGCVCAFLSAYLILKGWSLIGDALSHSVVPGVAGAYALGLPLAFGAFFTGMLAALLMVLARHYTRLREDAIIGLVFSAFFAAGLLMLSLRPAAINVQSIIFGNILGIDDADARQMLFVLAISLALLMMFRKDLLAVFFDEGHALTLGLSPLRLKILFFALLSASTVAALQTVGAILVIAMVITPGATAYLLTDRFSRLAGVSMLIGGLTAGGGAWLSYYLDGATGGVIVLLQTLIFLLAFFRTLWRAKFAARRRPNRRSAP